MKISRKSRHFIVSGLLLAAAGLTLFGCMQNTTESSSIDLKQNNALSVSPSGAITTEMPATADTYVRKGAPNVNEGASPILRLNAAGDNRALIRFDPNTLAAIIGTGTLISATLELSILETKNNWGKNGREIQANRLLSDWAEGNGKNAEFKPKDSFKGTGVGATWNCAKDQLLDSKKTEDCFDIDNWEMRLAKKKPFTAPWIEQATDGLFINKKQDGVIAFDVTADVAAFLAGASNYGWVIRKAEENKAGYISFNSHETGAESGPRLVLTYQPAPVTNPGPVITPPANQNFTLGDAQARINTGSFTDASDAGPWDVSVSDGNLIGSVWILNAPGNLPQLSLPEGEGGPEAVDNATVTIQVRNAHGAVSTGTFQYSVTP